MDAATAASKMQTAALTCCNSRDSEYVALSLRAGKRYRVSNTVALSDGRKKLSDCEANRYDFGRMNRILRRSPQGRCVAPSGLVSRNSGDIALSSAAVSSFDLM